MLTNDLLLAVLLLLLFLHGAAAQSSNGDALLPGSSSGDNAFNDYDYDYDDNDEPCDTSFPLADADSLRLLVPAQRRLEQHQRHHPQEEVAEDYAEKLFVSIPDDDTGRSYAPLCQFDGGDVDGDGGSDKESVRRIDIRKLMRCNSGSCWNDFYQQCTFECTWSPPTPDVTNRPSPSPTTLTQTSNHVLLELQNLLDQYRLNSSVRAAIIEFLKQLIQERLGYGIEILDAQWPGRLPGQPHSLPLEITALGPTDVSQFSLSYILELLRENESELEEYLKKLDGGVPFKDVTFEFDTYDPNDIESEDTDSPSVGPTKAPVMIAEEAAKVKVMEEVEDKGGIPWWVWLIVVFVILCLLCCAVGYCQRKNEDDKYTGGAQNINIFMKKDGDESKGKKTSRMNKERDYISSGRSTATGMRSQRTRRTTTERREEMDDNATRRTSRTRRTARTAARGARTIDPQEEESRAARVREEDQDPMYDDLTMNAPTMAAVSVLPAVEGFDPPEEHALVPYSATNEQGGYRDPTMYVDGEPEQESRAEEPDGLKVDRKKSMFAADAMIQNDRANKSRKKRSTTSSRRSESFGNRLKSSITWKKPLDIDSGGVTGEDPSEYSPNNNRRDPDAITSDEVSEYKSRKSTSKNGKKKKKHSSTASRRSERRESFGDRIRSSFNWKSRGHENPIDISFDKDDDDYDSPSIMTRPNNDDHNQGRHGNNHHLSSGDIESAINVAQAHGYNNDNIDNWDHYDNEGGVT